MHDRAMHALHALGLAPIAETLADPNSYGFREGRRCADALEHAFIALARKNSAPWVLECDIRACFDEISHDWLLKNIPLDKPILQKWLKAGYMEKGQWFPTSKGTPQGGIVSPILANMTLDGMQEAIGQAVRRGDKVSFIRYADDSIKTGATKEILEQKVKPALTAFLKERGLELSEQKTVVTHIQAGFDFLGHTVRKFGDKLLIYPAKSNVQAFRDKIKLCVKSALGLSQEALLRKLNPIMQGWANYYRNGASKRTFAKLDYCVWNQLWRWAKRRHPNKPAHWRKQRYFSREDGRWNFHVTVRLANGESKVLKLYRMASTAIERHIKIKGKANPYDETYTEYFQKRRCFVGRVREPSASHPDGPPLEE
jgi:RNA-directed DNA polymerase